MIGNKIKGLGEIILRVNNMGLMKTFYQETIGLKLIKESENYTFFKIASGFGGHYQTLALFGKNNKTHFGENMEEIDSKKSTLHHFAFEIDKSDYEKILTFCISEKMEYKTDVFEWVNWKSIYVKDPESNIIEFVCFDANI